MRPVSLASLLPTLGELTAPSSIHFLPFGGGWPEVDGRLKRVWLSPADFSEIAALANRELQSRRLFVDIGHDHRSEAGEVLGFEAFRGRGVFMDVRWAEPIGGEIVRGTFRGFSPEGLFEGGKFLGFASRFVGGLLTPAQPRGFERLEPIKAISRELDLAQRSRRFLGLLAERMKGEDAGTLAEEEAALRVQRSDLAEAMDVLEALRRERDVVNAIRAEARSRADLAREQEEAAEFVRLVDARVRLWGLDGSRLADVSRAIALEQPTLFRSYESFQARRAKTP